MTVSTRNPWLHKKIIKADGDHEESMVAQEDNQSRCSILSNLEDGTTLEEKDLGFTLSESKKTKKKHKRKIKYLQAIEKYGNWRNLPLDLLFIIFEKLGVYEIVHRAQFVCSAWRALSKEPRLFRSIDFECRWEFMISNPGLKLTKLKMIENQIVARCFALSVCSSMPVLHRKSCVVDKPQYFIKILNLQGVSGDVIMKFINNVPFLQELTLVLKPTCNYQNNPATVIAEIGRSCEQLKYFCWSGNYCYCHGLFLYQGEQVSAIVKYMPQLGHLCIQRDVIRNEELEVILHGCPYLEHLDLEYCHVPTHLTSEELLNQCRNKFKTLKLPNSGYQPSLISFDYSDDEWDLDDLVLSEVNLSEGTKTSVDYDNDIDNCNDNLVFLPAKSATWYI